MKSSMLPYWLSLLVLFGALYGGWKIWQSEEAKNAHSLAFSAEQEVQLGPLEPFTLTECSGKPFHSESLKGKVWATYIFFIECRTVCSRMTAEVSRLTQDEELKDVKFISITCDPVNDTIERLDEYAQKYGADRSHWFFCTGDFDNVQHVGGAILGSTVKMRNHSESLVVVDRTGTVRGMFNLLDPYHLEAARKKMIECLQEDVLSTENASPPENATTESQPDEKQAG